MAGTAMNRRAWMAELAMAPTEALERHLEENGGAPDYSWLRAPEFGSVMVQGRAGGKGAAFNLGEMTVTRCALRLADGGTVGHAYVQGRRALHAELAALYDALLQIEETRPALEAELIRPLAARREGAKAERSHRANSTKVDFFTMVRGENPT